MKTPSLKKWFYSEAGFTLPEIMIGGAILAGVALAGATLMKEQRLAQKKVNEEQELAIFHKNLMQQMMNPFNCTATFAGFNQLGQGTIGAGTINKLYKCKNVSSVAPECSNMKAGPSALTISNADTAAPLLEVGSWTDNIKQTWKVTAIQNTAIAGTGNFQVKITYQLNPNKFPNPRSLTKDIHLTARFTKAPSVFKECLNSQESSINNLQNDLCSSMSIDSTGAVATWDEITQKCVMKGSTSSHLKDCPPGTVVEGVRSDGSVHCVTPTKNQVCPSGKSLQFNNATMKIQCM